jgi:TolB-like protein
MGTSKPQPLSNFPEPSGERLDSWKEIAAYLKRDERTVRRWEKEGLPVRRKIHKKQASVFAYRAEIDAWWHDGQPQLEHKEQVGARTRLVSWVVVGSLTAGLATLLVLYVAGLRDRVRFSPAAPTIRSLAVLPLENLSGDASQEYFVDGMTDALTTDLAQISDLQVISRTSAMQYKGARKSLPEVARALGVDAVVEGSVVRSGSRVRITAQLIHAPSDLHLWAESFEGSADDVLSLQDIVARAITERIQGKLSSQLRPTKVARKPIHPEAYEDYVRGLYFFDKREAEASIRSVDYFRRAIAVDPEFAPAYAGLAEALPASYWFNDKPPVEVMVEAKAAAKQALALDDRSAEAHTALGGLLSLYDWNWSEAEKELKSALELNPNSSLAHERYMMWLQSQGQVTEALTEAKRAQQLDPLSFFMNRELGHGFYIARRYDEALEQLRRADELKPNNENWTALVLEQQGKQQEAILLRLEQKIQISTEEVAPLREANVMGGWKGYWAKWIQFHSRGPRAEVNPYYMATAEARLGHADKAWNWMEKSADQREVWVTWIKVDPALDSVRSHPGYRRLLQRINLRD